MSREQQAQASLGGARGETHRLKLTPTWAVRIFRSESVWADALVVREGLTNKVSDLGLPRVCASWVTEELHSLVPEMCLIINVSYFVQGGGAL